MSAVLIFLLDIEYPNEFFKQWITIRDFRNNKVAHSKSNKFPQDSEFMEKINLIMDFLSYIYDCKNYKKSHKNDIYAYLK